MRVEQTIIGRRKSSDASYRTSLQSTVYRSKIHNNTRPNVTPVMLAQSMNLLIMLSDCHLNVRWFS